MRFFKLFVIIVLLAGLMSIIKPANAQQNEDHSSHETPAEAEVHPVPDEPSEIAVANSIDERPSVSYCKNEVPRTRSSASEMIIGINCKVDAVQSPSGIVVHVPEDPDTIAMYSFTGYLDNPGLEITVQQKAENEYELVESLSMDAKTLALAHAREVTAINERRSAVNARQTTGEEQGDGFIGNGCTNWRYNFISGNWALKGAVNYDWWLSIDTKPWYLTSWVNIRDEVIRGWNNLENVDNPCGLPDVNPKNFQYQGYTNSPVDMFLDTNGIFVVGPFDDKDEVGYMQQPPGMFSGFLATASTLCNVTLTNKCTDVEIAIDKNLMLGNFWFLGAVDPNCIADYSLESVITHEVGHGNGLTHPHGDHPELTMNSYLVTCSRHPVSLACGDVRGLSDLYNPGSGNPTIQTDCLP